MIQAKEIYKKLSIFHIPTCDISYEALFGYTLDMPCLRYRLADVLHIDVNGFIHIQEKESKNLNMQRKTWHNLHTMCFGNHRCPVIR